VRQLSVESKAMEERMNHIEMMRLAEEVADMSICPERHVGAVVVLPDGRTMATHNWPTLDESNAHHAEARLVNLSSDWDLMGATLYTTCRPCVRCTNMLLGLGLKAIYYRDAQPEMNHLIFLEQEGVVLDGRWILGQTQDSWADRWQSACDACPQRGEGVCCGGVR
jgi:deoxycytidylate deaminase